MKSGPKPMNKALSKYAQGMELLNNNIIPCMRFIQDILGNHYKFNDVPEKVKIEAKQWACEMVLKKAFPDKIQFEDVTKDKPELLAAIEKYIDQSIKKDAV